MGVLFLTSLPFFPTLGDFCTLTSHLALLMVKKKKSVERTKIDSSSETSLGLQVCVTPYKVEGTGLTLWFVRPHIL